uniref:Uncharacterized protein n=1 Tax=Arundo donax TaxID=35708 RepID=A0A0A8YSG8_ARUDO
MQASTTLPPRARGASRPARTLCPPSSSTTKGAPRLPCRSEPRRGRSRRPSCRPDPRRPATPRRRRKRTGLSTPVRLCRRGGMLHRPSCPIPSERRSQLPGARGRWRTSSGSLPPWSSTPRPTTARCLRHPTSSPPLPLASIEGTPTQPSSPTRFGSSGDGMAGCARRAAQPMTMVAGCLSCVKLSGAAALCTKKLVTPRVLH